MRTRPFGKTRRTLPVIGQGTWAMERDDRKKVVAAIHRGLELGMTHIDTAEMYGSGEVERILSEALAGRRDEVYLVSKVLPQNATRTGTVKACEQSLKRLGTDHLDCYLLHWPGRHPIQGTLDAFEELLAAGKIKSYGVSNFDTPELMGLVEMAAPGRITCNQVLYHLEERAIEETLMPACTAAGVTVVAYSPFGSGRFPGPRTAGGKALGELAKAHGVSPYTIALAYLVRDPAVLTIPKASTPAHVEENAKAGDLVLSPEDIARLDKVFPRGRWRGLPTL